MNPNMLYLPRVIEIWLSCEVVVRWQSNRLAPFVFDKTANVEARRSSGMAHYRG